MVATSIVGWGFVQLPHSMEWAELIIGIPVMLAVYGFIIWKWAFKLEDRTLFKKMDAEPSALDLTREKPRAG